MELTKSLKQSKLLKYVFLALIGSIILAVSSKIKIPFYPVPMTMQTLVVLLIGVGFGWKLGLATISLYLLEGIIGLPVFSGTPENGIGLIYFTGPTMGYLLGFLVAVYISGKFDYNSEIHIAVTGKKQFLKVNGGNHRYAAFSLLGFSTVFAHPIAYDKEYLKKFGKTMGYKVIWQLRKDLRS